MPKIAYRKQSFRGESLDAIHHADRILCEYAAQGYDLTLRGLYYKFIARDLFPDDRKWIQRKRDKKWIRDPSGTKNAQPNYKWLGDKVSDARLAGLISWDHIIDMTRRLSGLRQYDTPEDAVVSLSSTYHIDMWKNQPYYVEAWVEKDAMVNVLRPACNIWDVPYCSTRGYTSQSSCHEAAQRLIAAGQLHEDGVVILHLSDHDPSGIDMARDLQDRLKMFRCGPIQFRRIALTFDQVEERSPPPSPAKLTDPRAAGYIERFGDESWELDALEPQDIDTLIRDEVMAVVDMDIWNESCEEEKRGRSTLLQVANGWPELTEEIDPGAALALVESYCDPIEDGQDGDS